MDYKFIDLFAGLGGFRIAFERNGGECVFSSEIDKYVAQIYEENFGEPPYGDITTIKSEDIPDFDILCAGFPCQPFSIGGKRLGFEDSRGTLFFEVARILKDKKPKAFILENVKGLVNHDGGRTLKVITSILDEIGYNFDYKVMNALDYGIPQNRERWYCVGFRKELNINFVSTSTFNLFSELTYQFPEKSDYLFLLEDIVDQEVINGYEATARALENIEKFIPDFSEKKGINNNHLLVANEVRPSRCSFKNNGTVPCLTAKMGTGGNNVPIIVNYGRKMTEKECLRLMGFPDDYIIKQKSYQSYKQIGNSVVVTIIEKLAKEVVRVLKEFDSK